MSQKLTKEQIERKLKGKRKVKRKKRTVKKDENEVLESPEGSDDYYEMPPTRELLKSEPTSQPRKKKKKVKVMKQEEKTEKSEEELQEQEDFNEAQWQKQVDESFKESCSFWSCLQWLIILAIVFGGLAWMKSQQENYSWGEQLRRKSMERNQGQSLNFYEVLQIDSQATKSEIKKKYKKLALKHHPDRNPNCAECDDKMAEISKAYSTLSNDEKREIYDQTLGSFDTYSSEAIELSVSNYEELVLQSKDMWVIQIYAEWYEPCKAFSPVWEDVVRSLGSYIKFGRVHSSRESSLLRRLPANIVIHPTVFSMINGKYINTYDIVRIPRTMIEQISSDFPSTALLGTPQNMAIFKNKLHRRSKNPNAFILTTPKGGRVSILVKALAKKYEGAVQVAVVSPKKGTTRTRFLAIELEKEFELETFNRPPSAFIYNGKNDVATWIDETITKSTVENLLLNFLSKRVIRFSESMFGNICLGSEKLICALLLQNCGEKADSKKNKADLKFYKHTLAFNTMEDFDLNKEMFEPRKLQFGVVDVSRTTKLSAYCAKERGTSQLAVIFDGGERYTGIPNFDALDNLFQFLHLTFDGKSSYPILRGPQISCRPAPGLSYFIQAREFIDDFDYRNEETVMNVGFGVSIVVGLIGAYYVGAKGILIFLMLAGFLISALPTLMPTILNFLKELGWIR